MTLGAFFLIQIWGKSSSKTLLHLFANQNTLGIFAKFGIFQSNLSSFVTTLGYKFEVEPFQKILGTFANNLEEFHKIWQLFSILATSKTLMRGFSNTFGCKFNASMLQMIYLLLWKKIVVQVWYFGGIQTNLEVYGFWWLWVPFFSSKFEANPLQKLFCTFLKKNILGIYAKFGIFLAIWLLL